MSEDVTAVRIGTLERIASRGEQAWERIAPRYDVTNPLPPWKSSLDGMCDALDRNPDVLELVDRRRDEDLLSHGVYSELPFPESQLVALAHSLIARGAIDEQALDERIRAVRARLESAAQLPAVATSTTVAEGALTSTR